MGNDFLFCELLILREIGDKFIDLIIFFYILIEMSSFFIIGNVIVCIRMFIVNIDINFFLIGWVWR